ncbi:MAG: DUF2975 domain-containing protein [Puia sp.]
MRTVKLAVSVTDSTQVNHTLHLERFENAYITSRDEMTIDNLSPLQKIFAPRQPQTSEFFDLLTSWISCICVLLVIFLLFRIDPSKPFLPEIAKIITFLGWVVFSLGLLDVSRTIYFDRIVHEVSHGVYRLDRLSRLIPTLLLSCVIFWLGRTIKKAATLQKENDLTI